MKLVSLVNDKSGIVFRIETARVPKPRTNPHTGKTIRYYTWWKPGQVEKGLLEDHETIQFALASHFGHILKILETEEGLH